MRQANTAYEGHVKRGADGGQRSWRESQPAPPPPASDSPSYGYNARTDEYEDLVAAVVIDPTRVTRTALQNASSIAGLLLTEPRGRKAERIGWMNRTGGGPQALRRFALVPGEEWRRSGRVARQT